jgi:hypothetical protein
MKIHIVDGKIASYSEAKFTSSVELSNGAIKALLHCPPMPPQFTGYLDTETRTYTSATKPMPRDEVSVKGDYTPDAVSIPRFNPMFGPNGPYMKPAASGGYVLYADHVLYAENDGQHIKAMAEAKDRLATALDTAHKADAERRQAIARTMKLGQWIYAWPELIERIVDLVNENKRNEDAVQEWRDSATNWRHNVGTVLWPLEPKKEYTLGMVLETIVDYRTRMQFAEDFEKQVRNLLGIPEGLVDSVYYAIQSLVVASKDNRPDKLRREINRLVTDLTMANQSIAARQEELELWRNEVSAVLNVAADMLTVPYVVEAIAALQRAGEASVTNLYEHPPVAPEPVGKAAFECTFEWAREHWDLLFDSIFYKIINEHGDSGYIKVVTTS